MPNRPQIPMEQVYAVLQRLRDELRNRLAQKGYGSFSSSHEIQGVLQEEFDELKEAIHKNNSPGIEAELYDIAVGVIFAVACIDADCLDW